MSADPIRDFAAALHAGGLLVHASAIIADGKIRRCKAEGDKHGKQSGWYVLHLDGSPAGAFGDWRSGHRAQWVSDCATADPATRARLAEAVRKAEAQRECERMQNRLHAQRDAIERWQRATPADPAHPYLQRKRVGVHGLRQSGPRLLVPMRDGRGALWAVQSINEDGNKRFMRGARKRGLYHAIGTDVAGVLCIAEGYATAASIFEATGYPVAVAFDCGNLQPVAKTLRGKYPQARILICADNDTATEERTGRNPGIEAATQAAQAVGGVVASPFDFPATGKDMHTHARTDADCAG